MKAETAKKLRLLPVGILALAVSFPIALISLAKLLLILSSMAIIAMSINNFKINKYTITDTIKSTPIHNILIILSFALTLISVFWSTAPDNSFYKSLMQHGNLLIIPMIAIHIKSKDEALTIFKIFVLGQLFVIISSWLIFIGLKPPWAIATVQKYAVFSSELDQSIMNAIFASVLWHMREQLFSKNSKIILIPILLSIYLIFYIFEGRSGQLVMLAMLSLTFWWALPHKFKIAALFFPLLLFIALISTSDIFQHRFEKVATEIQGYTQNKDSSTSTGTRLDFWINSIKIAEKNPIYGSGAGSWTNEYYAIKNDSSMPYITGNSHQEFLLWLVEFGWIGLVVLLGIFYSFFYTSIKMEVREQRATISVIVGIAVACLFNCVLHDALIGDYLCFIIGLLLTFSTNTSKSRI